MAAFVIDLGNIGDDFGDVYDTYVPAQPVTPLDQFQAEGVPIQATTRRPGYHPHNSLPAWVRLAWVIESWPLSLKILIYLLCRVLRL